MEVLHSPPSPSSYTPLSTHQSRTPSSFYSSQPVLHHASTDATLLVPSPSHPLLAALAPTNSAPTNGAPTNSTNPPITSQEDRLIRNISVWVTSERFTLYHPPTSTGLSIPYPTISLHAIQRLRLPSPAPAAEVQGLFMQIETPDADGYDDDAEGEDDAVVSLTLVPGGGQAGEANAERGAGGEAETSPIDALFAAVSACANLHPDPVLAAEEGDEGMGTGAPVMLEGGVGYEGMRTAGGQGVGDGDGRADGIAGLPPAVPRSGGWITAENVGEWFDGEGNFVGGGAAGGLGPGGVWGGVGAWGGGCEGREEEQEERRRRRRRRRVGMRRMEVGDADGDGGGRGWGGRGDEVEEDGVGEHGRARWEMRGRRLSV
ncbi:MAG: hypothetical protein FRX48_04830 [Lasallia pustulata]|uniref:Regulator of volume decrease after cellular swelling-domain-containing protein n=1 Tax=Lasallia pustulata TaxID=136370 RepID=A0A5M8PPX2_9LECA|nr:MAG: hypothetical protein FRX48_04830 [Lasallia pustulata]